jgi:hypothetical protein
MPSDADTVSAFPRHATTVFERGDRRLDLLLDHMTVAMSVAQALGR